MGQHRPLKIVFVVTEDWAFLSHRLPMARAALDSGAEVVVATRDNGNRQRIEALGVKVAHIPFARRNINPVSELLVAIRLWALFLRERPDIVHNIALKPIMDGTLAALLSPVGHVVNTYTGLGAVFIGDGKSTWLRRLLISVFGFFARLRSVSSVVQNDDDMEHLSRLQMIQPAKTSVIRGSGVNLDDYAPAPEPEGDVVVTAVSRLLHDKGIRETVEAARLLHERGVGVRIRIAGDRDPENPASVSEQELSEWQDEGVVEFMGHQSDVSRVWAESHIAVLASYREGLPKSLLEAAACGRPMVATDVPGCREIVRNEENGLLVPPRNAEELANAIGALVEDGALRRRMGVEARRNVEEKYSDQVVERETRALYMAFL